MNKISLYKNGNSLSYADFGNQNGYPILIQHGLIASILDQHLFNRLVEKGARLISIARPGYGESSPYEMKNLAEWADIVSALVSELGLSQFDVFGISSGAPFSYALAAGFPDQVRNLFILSGIPALYDENVRSFWPFPVKKDASILEMQNLADEIFFSHLSKEDFDKNEIKDSGMNHFFGVAQDLRLRGMGWGFELSDVKCRVAMRHSKADEAVPLITAEMTSKLLPNCRLEIRENDAHFSQEVLNDFISTAMSDMSSRLSKASRQDTTG